MMIEHRPCPSCGIPNTARMTDGVALCFNCRASWDPGDPEGTLRPANRPRAVPPPAAPEPPYAFTARQIERLRVYRAAVTAGYYNEGLPARRRAA